MVLAKVKTGISVKTGKIPCHNVERIDCGIPQGSVLGQSKYTMFADATNIHY